MNEICFSIELFCYDTYLVCNTLLGSVIKMTHYYENYVKHWSASYEKLFFQLFLTIIIYFVFCDLLVLCQSKLLEDGNLP